jgi:hypothetical protein
MNRIIANSVDIAVDFATLGEYRVIAAAPARKVEAADIWAIDVEWTAPERERSVCSLPRARDRKLARASIRG